MHISASRADLLSSPSLAAVTMVLVLAGAGCLAGELAGGPSPEEEERSAASLSDAEEPLPLEISEAEYEALLAEDEAATATLDPPVNAEDSTTPDFDAAGGAADDLGADGEREIFAVSKRVEGLVHFKQTNATYAAGSCGAHAGAVALGYLVGIRRGGSGAQSAVTAIEKYVYARVPKRPGMAALVKGYNQYLAAKKSPWRAKSFTSAGSILTYLQKGAPVVVHTSQWGGHYVTLYGRVGSYVYFSDGLYSDGLSSVKLSSGYWKKWVYSTFLKYCKGHYAGFSR